MEESETPPQTTSQPNSLPKNESPLANPERQRSFADLVREKGKDSREVQAEAASMLLGFYTRLADKSEPNSILVSKKQIDVQRANSLADAVREHGTTSDEAKRALLEFLNNKK